ncbi:MAG: beta strand repeat-containing protein, partial [Actinomycetota bacterium]
VTPAGQVTIGAAATGSNFCVIEASQASTSAYSAAGPLSQSFHILQKSVTGQFNVQNKTYDGTNSATITSRWMSGVVGTDDVSLAGGTATFSDATAGIGKLVTATGFALSSTLAGNYTLAPGPWTTTANINKADATRSISGFSGPFDGLTHGATGSCTGINGTDVSGGIGYGATFVNVPGGTAHWTFSGAPNYNDQAGDVAITLSKVDPNCSSIVGYSGPYDGAAHGASGSCTGVGGAALSGVNLGTSYTDAPGGTAHWTYTDATGNYNNAAGNVEITIGKTNATCNIVGYTGAYDGTSHGATGSCTGLNSANLSSGIDYGSTFTDHHGGTAHWTFSGGTNYNDQSGDVSITINRINATCNIVGYSGTYDASAHGASGSCTGLNSSNLSSGISYGSTFTDYPGGTAHWTFSGGTNYNDQSGDVAIAINKATATCSVTTYDVTFDGHTHSAAGSCSGVNNADLSSLLHITSTHLDAGTYSSDSWSFDGNTNYNPISATPMTDRIKQATATCAIVGYTGTYDGSGHGASGSCTGVGGASLTAVSYGATYTHPTGGNAHWTFSGGTNYKDDSGDVTITINKATATCTVTPYTVTYDAHEHSATGSCTGVNGEALSGSLLHITSAHTDAGSYSSDSWTFDGNGDYNPITTRSITDTISKASATISVTAYHVTYNGSPHTASGTATGVSGENLSSLLDLTHTMHTSAGTYSEDYWTFAGNTNYKTVTNTVITDVIDKADQTITLSTNVPNYIAYGDGPFTVTASASSGLPVSVVASGPCSVSQTSATQWSLTITGANQNCTITASQGGNENYNAAPNRVATYYVNPQFANVAYNGQTFVTTSGSSSTTASVTLSASVQATAGNIALARVTFIDDLTGKILASGVKVSPVAGSTTPTGTSNVIVTLSSGQYGEQEYRVKVKLDTGAGSCYTNAAQLADATSAAYATIVVAQPNTASHTKGTGSISHDAPWAPAGTYGSGSAQYTIGMAYNKSGSNPQGLVDLIIATSSDGTYYVKSNSITSFNSTTNQTSGYDASIYTKASIYRIYNGVTTSIDGGVTLRVDAHDAGGTASGDTVAFTVLSSKTGNLYYSNNWVYDDTAKAWRTMPESVSTGAGCAIQIA